MSTDPATRYPPSCAPRPLSVVIPCYNCEHWLSQAVYSVLEQKDVPTPEVVLVDDGSTDGTADLADQIAKLDPHHVRVIHKPNRGAAHARNVGVRISTGAVILFLDADDIMPPHRAAQSLDFLSGYDMAYGQLHEFRNLRGGPGPRLTPIKVLPPSVDLLGNGNGFRIGTACCWREVFTVHGCWLDESFAAGEDWDWMLGCLETGLRVGCSKDNWLFRRFVPGSLHSRHLYGPITVRIKEKHRELFAQATLGPVEERWRSPETSGYL